MQQALPLSEFPKVTRELADDVQANPHRRPVYAIGAGATAPWTTARHGRGISRDFVSRMPVASALAILLVLFYAYFDEWPADVLTVGTFVLAAAVLFRVARVSRDWFNSLTVLLALCLIRFALPGLSLFDPNWTPPSGSLAQGFDVTRPEAIFGAHLAAIGVLGTMLGWFAAPTSLTRPADWLYRQASHMQLDPRLAPVAVAVIAFGVVAAGIGLTLSYGNPITAAISGVARGGGAAGTARYSFLAVAALTTASVLLALYLAQRKASLGWALLPALFATAVLTVFGGRVNALAPLGISALGAYYVRRSAGASGGIPRRRSIGWRVLGMTSVIVLLGGYVIFVPAYRSGSGVSAVSDVTSPTHVRDYVDRTSWTEVGMLQSYALAGRLGAGEMNGSSYPALLGLPARLGPHFEKPGDVLVERLGPLGPASGYGIHTGVVVDVFLNSGLLAAVLAAIVFGMLLRAEYVAFTGIRPTLGTALLHGLLVWAAVWTFFSFMADAPGLIIKVVLVALAIFAARQLLATRQPA